MSAQAGYLNSGFVLNNVFDAANIWRFIGFDVIAD
jgi:hypothetical protein